MSTLEPQAELKPPTTILPPYNQTWPPDYKNAIIWRHAKILEMTQPTRKARDLRLLAIEFYKHNPIDFINHWCVTVDPRKAEAFGALAGIMPLILFQRQAELVQFVYECLDAKQNGLIEKSRDMGATWVCCAISVHLWLFRPGMDIGWGSRHKDLVDRMGVTDSIFEKIRILIRGLPRMFWPTGFDPSPTTGHMFYMRILNPETGSSITGEIGDNIGRGGRKGVFFKDESAHYEHAEMIEAALMSNTDCQIDISSVNGLGNVFHRKRESGVDWYP